MNKKYSIRGVNLNSEILVGLSILPFIIISGIVTPIFFNHLTNVDYNNIPFYVVFGGLTFGAYIGLFFAKFLGKRMSSIWNIELANNDLSIGFKEKKLRFNLDDVSKFKIYGNPNFKYVSFFLLDNQYIKMRIGNSGLTPFSSKEDLQNLDAFLKDLQPYFEKEYHKIDKLKKVSPPGTVKLTYLKEKK